MKDLNLKYVFHSTKPKSDDLIVNDNHYHHATLAKEESEYRKCDARLNLLWL